LDTTNRNAGFGRKLLCSVILCAFASTAWSEGMNTDETMRFNAVVDVSPLAKKLNELAKLSVLSTGILKEQFGALGAEVKANTEAVKKIETSLKQNADEQSKKIDEMAAMLTKIQQSLAVPVAYDYRILRTTSENRLKELGAGGWTLVTGTDAGWLIFQKPLYTKPTIQPEE